MKLDTQRNNSNKIQFGLSVQGLQISDRLYIAYICNITPF